ncbi:hypothetical protein MBLNU13_g02503t1 [Cladosporium sp. NU13]
MEGNDEDEDVKLARASAGLLSDLESCLQKVLWKKLAQNDTAAHGRVHSRVRQKDLDYIINLIEPFQGEPHLLDTKLKALLPPIVEAYIESLLKLGTRKASSHVDIQTALSSIIYTLCKVRGAKVIVGFFNNEPRYLDPILTTLEDVTFNEGGDEVSWKVSYVLLLWLSHLLLTPFDLASISARPVRADSQTARMSLHTDLPTVAQRVIQVGAIHLSASTKAQDAAAAMLVRLATRPDMQRFRLADSLVNDAVARLAPSAESPVTIYQQLGPLRFLAGIVTSADVAHVLPDIYRACEKLSEDGSASPVTENAVGKKLIVKIFRNIAILTLRLPSVSGPLLSFLETTSVLEDVIDHLLQSLGDRDTPVRYAAAKAISLIISELAPEMGHEVIQAVLDTFKEDIPRSAVGIDYQTVNALKWHGLTLTLSHALFKRSASPSQLLDILNALVSALNFEQRTATGSSVGTNVRDAANFGIWSLSRRYTSDELLSVDMNDLRSVASSSKQATVIQVMAVQLLLSACLDPAGNIRRGSSAALQELIGRHPNQVTEGIAIVQIVDYQAVGLRKRGLIDVAGKAASLDRVYWEALVDGMTGWRGLSSVDVISREAAASSLANFVTIAGDQGSQTYIDKRLLAGLEHSDIESIHGIICSLSNLLDLPTDGGTGKELNVHRRYWQLLQACGILQVDFNPRTLRSELPVAIAKLITGVCHRESDYAENHVGESVVSLNDVESAVGRLLARHEKPILEVVPAMVKQVNRLTRLTAQASNCLDLQSLGRAVAADSSKAVLSGAGRAIALGAITIQQEQGLTTEEAALSISTLSNLVTVANVDWRIIGLRALHLVIQDLDSKSYCETEPLTIMIQALHTGLTDYTIDERGDVGSLVRLQALMCTSSLLSLDLLNLQNEQCQILLSDTLRLSLEKLDRVRGRAAACRQQCLPYNYHVQDHDNINSKTYLRSALRPIFDPNTQLWARRALIEGAISCAGISGESLLQASREVITEFCTKADTQHLHTILTTFSETLRDILSSSTPNATNLMLPALDLLAFLHDMHIPQQLATAQTSFRWRTLLSTVQKSHHKSSDVPKLLAAVNVYRGLAEVESIRGEVVKKLLSMLATNPYPRIKIAVADVVFEILGAEEMKVVNWAEKGVAQAKIVGELKSKYVESV